MKTLSLPDFASMVRVRRAVALSMLLAAGSLVSACRDLENGISASPTPKLPAGAQLILEPRLANDSSMVVGLRLVGLDSPAVVSVTAEVVYDTTRLRFAFDGSPDDGALRAMHASRGRVMVAVAHATGLTGEVAARLRFVARDTSAYQTLALTIREMHRSDASDARSRVSVLPLQVVR